MRSYLVKDLMVPISEYATVSEEATLYDAVLALEKAQQDYQKSRYSHRAVLVLNKEKRVVGKLSQLDFLSAMEPRDDNLLQIRNFKKFGFSRKAVALQQEEYLKNCPLIIDARAKAASMKVIDYMQRPTEGEYVEENASLDMALHQLTAGHNLSLLVTSGKEIIGILRLSDAFAALSSAIIESE